MKSHLKVKLFSLTHEMTYIRRQEEKWKNKARAARKKQKEHVGYQDKINYHMDNFWSQHWHRQELKYHARHTLLAHGCMKGTPYQKMEVICYGPLKGYGSMEPMWDEVSAMVERFSKGEPNQQEINQRAAEWIADAKAWYEGNEARIKHMRKLMEIKRSSAEWIAEREARKERDAKWYAVVRNKNYPEI